MFEFPGPVVSLWGLDLAPPPSTATTFGDGSAKWETVVAAGGEISFACRPSIAGYDGWLMGCKMPMFRVGIQPDLSHGRDARAASWLLSLVVFCRGVIIRRSRDARLR